MGLTALAFTIFTAVNVMEFHLKSIWNSTINLQIHYQAQFYCNTQYTTFLIFHVSFICIQRSTSVF